MSSLDHIQIVNENHSLKEKVNELTQDIANFVIEMKNLDKLLGPQKGVFDKVGFGYRRHQNKKTYKNFFTPAKKAKEKCSHCNKFGHKTQNCYYMNKQKCSYCHKFSHQIKNCFYKNRNSNRKGTNPIGPNRM